VKVDKDIKRAVSLDKETDRLLSQLARRFEDNKSLCVRELIRAAAQQYVKRDVKPETAQATR
jgi:predicted transcriptional regulator